MPFMYILRCVDDTLYTGSTWDLQRRLDEHARGEGSRHTAKRLPVDLIYFEEFDRIDAAFLREKQIQRWTRAKKLALINGAKASIRELSECRNPSHAKNRQIGPAKSNGG